MAVLEGLYDALQNGLSPAFPVSTCGHPTLTQTRGASILRSMPPGSSGVSMGLQTETLQGLEVSSKTCPTPPPPPPPQGWQGTADVPGGQR